MAPESHLCSAVENGLRMHSSWRRDAMLCIAAVTKHNTYQVCLSAASNAPFVYPSSWPQSSIVRLDVGQWQDGPGGGGWLEGGGHSVTLTNCLVIFLWSHNLDWNNHIKTQANMSTSAHATSAQISQCAGFSSSYPHFILLFYPHICASSVSGW